MPGSGTAYRGRVIVVSALAAVFACLFSGVARAQDEDGGAVLRKRLFLLERQLARRTERRGLTDGLTAHSNWPPAPWMMTIEKINAEDKQSAEDAEKKQQFGSVSLTLGNGKFTSFSYSSTGLDLSSVVPGYGVKVLLREKDRSAGSANSDTSLGNNYAAAQHPFYGLRGYERFNDMLTPEQKTKDYLFTGMGMTLDAGGYTLGLLNFSRPPVKKQKVFFGSGSAGPYAVGATNIVPGGVKVRVDGTELVEIANYTIDYTRGEITFTSPVAENNRVVVQYDVPDSGGGPGKFTGFRVEKNKDQRRGRGEGAEDAEKGKERSTKDTKSAKENETALPVSRLPSPVSRTFGFSYFTDQVVTYKPGAAGATQDYTNHTLFGVDGARPLGKHTQLGFEFARSNGNKQREIGRYAEQHFTIADTKASDGSPLGPYALDTTRLPVMDGTEEVRLNGQLLERDKDYLLDAQYGYLTLRRKDLNLTTLDDIRVTWRYLTDADRLTGNTGAVSDTAHALEFKNIFGKATHIWRQERRGPDFLQVGGKASNELRNTAQTLALPIGKALKFNAEQSENRTLQDAASNLTLTAARKHYAFDFKPRGPLTASFQTDTDTRRDGRSTDDTRRAARWQASYKLPKETNLGFTLNTQRATGKRTSGSSLQTSRDMTWKLTSKPIKPLSLDVTTARGRGSDLVNREGNTSRRRTDAVKVQYTPIKSLSVTYDNQADRFQNLPTAGSAPRAATGTAAPNANRAARWNVTWKVNPSFTMSYSRDGKREQLSDAAARTDQTQWDARYAFSKDADAQFRFGTQRSARNTSSQDVRMPSLALRVRPKWLRDMEMNMRWDGQRSVMGANAGGVETTTRMRGGNTTVSLSAAPFWEGKKWTLEKNARKTISATGVAAGDTTTSDRERGMKIKMEFPFFNKGTLTADTSRTTRGGTRPSNNRTLEMSLKWPVARDMSLSATYRKQNNTDAQYAQSSTRARDLTIQFEGDRAW